ncbi:cellulase family glycosylhydrolase [Coprococcus eutactus]|uniref:cellulase family glycosylhydrolase n=1 Tax=Coprococcus eutactus TaxID=33043 RepID=UPI00015EA4AA|nr:cellulase family glycosylhydrolase [Coprococcus eutactus]EDP27617.1 cellulase (glycosyl hydrolase family 5) [Coprococcus eutactus ATCC 27759]MBT9730286.1 cellulase family glycosylhydrolase [Coprococcus eutactus]UEA79933.1 cellulase family glycosylhydrolase [Coprococcus eutactus ATCC 27759]UWP18189.1 cellulase family glycosylhydrolase [Coprococcus eutactus]
MKNKKTLIMGIIIGVLVVVIGVMGYMLIKGRTDGRDKDGQDSTQNISTDVTDKDLEQDTSDKAADMTSAAKKGDDADGKNSEKKSVSFYAEIGHDSTWEASGKICATENINIYNKTSSVVSGWKLDVIYKGKPAIEDIWNGEKKINEYTVSITPADYNQDIPAGGSVNVGYNIASDDLTVVDYILYIDGKEYRGSENLSADTSGATSNSVDAEPKDGKMNKVETTDKTDKTLDVTGGVAESDTKKTAEDGTPFDNHGQLSVKGTDIVDESGSKYQLKGVSTHGITWFPDYVNKDAFQSIRDDWDANLVRLAMYTDTGDSNGYCSGGDKDSIRGLVDAGVTAATELGMYVIIDWHILNDNNPNSHIDDAKEFFDDVSAKYSSNHNVIYEICNEPNGGTSWSDIKSYAEIIIPVIRKNDKNAIIIVGTPNWSQDVDIVSEDPITGYDNIMYAVHFYAATHKDDLRNKVKTAISNGLPVFVSEFSLCDASGNGGIDYDSSDVWFDLINDNNLSYASWSLCNKNETSALIKPDSTATSTITIDDLSDTGKYVRDKILGN